MLNFHLHDTLDSFSTKKPLMVFMIHGFGSTGKNILAFAKQSLKLENSIIFAPNAPRPTPQHSGYQWYSLQDAIDGITGAEFIDSACQLRDFIKAKSAEYGLENILLLGFSQGSALSIHLALNEPLSYRYIIGCSGRFMPNILPTNTETPSAPICLIHGDADEILPSRHSEDTSRELSRMNIPNQLHIIKGLGHSLLDARVINIIDEVTDICQK